VLKKLMDMVGYTGHVRDDLSAEEKQEIIDKARKKERSLWEQLGNVRRQLDNTLDVQSAEGRSLRVRLNRLKVQVREEAAKARDLIFRQINEVDSMATEFEGVGGGCIKFDFHGLYVADAVQKVEEMVLPLLNTIGRIMLITGRGLHSRVGDGCEVHKVHSVLKAAVVGYLQERGLRVEPLPDNEGAIYVLCQDVPPVPSLVNT
jgi:hypothetical protein